MTPEPAVVDREMNNDDLAALCRYFTSVLGDGHRCQHTEEGDDDDIRP